MARSLRIQFPGAVYHITSRGNARDRIFLGDGDRQGFLDILSNANERYNWICHAYCLMDNHYHLLIETIDPTLSMGMRHLNGVYTQLFNRTHRRVGHVFQGRFKAILVQKDSHLMELSRYVVLNPVRANMVKHPGDWYWSSYNATSNGRAINKALSIDWILSQFGPDKELAINGYIKFIAAGIDQKESVWDRLKAQIFFGSENYINSLKKEKSKNPLIKEIPRIQRFADRPDLGKIFVHTTNKADRNQKIYSAYVEHGYTMKEIAEHLSLHYTTVSKVINGMKN